jgi:hypothetical protein
MCCGQKRNAAKRRPRVNRPAAGGGRPPDQGAPTTDGEDRRGGQLSGGGRPLIRFPQMRARGR